MNFSKYELDIDQYESTELYKTRSINHKSTPNTTALPGPRTIRASANTLFMAILPSTESTIETQWVFMSEERRYDPLGTVFTTRLWQCDVMWGI